MRDILNRMLVKPGDDDTEYIIGRVVASRPLWPRYPVDTFVTYLWHRAADKRIGDDILHLVPESAIVMAVGWPEWPGAKRAANVCL